MLTIEVIPGAPLETNCYLVADVTAGEAMLVDAPWQIVDDIQQLAAKLQVKITEIVLTHGHWDHTMGLAELRDATGARTAVAAEDEDMVVNPTFAPFSFPWELVSVTPDRLLQDGDQIRVGESTFTVLATPGHTPGCICLYNAEEGLLFSGDTLFMGAHGRLDFPGGDAEKMTASLARLAQLPTETRVFPGHGDETTIGRERAWMRTFNYRVGY